MGKIPKNIIVGFNKREDTYTGKLGYVCSINSKGKADQQSLYTWSDKEMGFIETENEPTSGFVLNKRVGGKSYSWNPRQVKARVYDPRGWEFEISMDNLLYILEWSQSFPGKALDGEFVYAWGYGNGVYLLPVESHEYKTLMEASDKDKTPTIKKKDLKDKSLYYGRNRDTAKYHKTSNYIVMGSYGYVEFFNKKPVWLSIKGNTPSTFTPIKELDMDSHKFINKENSIFRIFDVSKPLNYTIVENNVKHIHSDKLINVFYNSYYRDQSKSHILTNNEIKTNKKFDGTFLINKEKNQIVYCRENDYFRTVYLKDIEHRKEVLEVLEVDDFIDDCAWNGVKMVDFSKYDTLKGRLLEVRFVINLDENSMVINAESINQENIIDPYNYDLIDIDLELC